jgi:ornithine carbamoyltransferase
MQSTIESPRHCLRITDFNAQELGDILTLSQDLKAELKKTGGNEPLLKGKTLAMIFEKPSLRTRISFEIGMTQLGGHALYLGPDDIQIGARESASDVGRVTGSMADMIMARTFSHQTVEELAQGSRVPVINGLSDLEHPCQILADYLTILEHTGKLTGLAISYFGDGNNNVTHSLLLMSAILGNEFRCASPSGYFMNPEIVKEAGSLAKDSGVKIVQTEDPAVAAQGADVMVTDTWVSMGLEAEKEERLKVFQSYQVTEDLMGMAASQAIFMHCLPAYRGKEVSAEVIDGNQSVVFDEAENRLHAQKGLLVYLSQSKNQA